MTIRLSNFSPAKTLWRKNITVLSTLALTASLLAALPDRIASADPTPTPSPTSSAPAASEPISIAKQQAKRQGKRVEIESLHTETSTTYANPDGKTLRLEMSTTPIRVKRNATWQSVDTTLVATTASSDL